MNYVFSLKSSKSKCGFLHLAINFTLLIFLGACQTAPRVSPEDLKFYRGKAEIYDKKKDKSNWVYFSSSAAYPEKLRMDVNLVLLNISLGTLIMDGNKAVLLNVSEGKAYQTNDGRKLLAKLLKSDIDPRDIVAIFSERFPLKGWTCEERATMNLCHKQNIAMEWTDLGQNERRLVINSDTAKVSFVYKTVEKGSHNFSLEVPRGYTPVQL